MFSKADRKKFSEQKARQISKPGFGLSEKDKFNIELDRVERVTGPVVYWNAKFQHAGITAYKVFENCNRKTHSNSLRNLLNVSTFANPELAYYVREFKLCNTDDQRCTVNDQACFCLDKQNYVIYLQETRQHRKLNPAQSRRVKRLANKLCYYSQERQFTSKKTGNYSMKVAFLTLTSPDGTPEVASLKAFNLFLDYLRRTANCVYVWKKELGDKNGKLHFHVIINNFVTYYIISWKWKRLLLNEGVSWPLTPDGKHTDSHYRVELPRSRKLVAHYIAKYMSKAYDLPREFGYIAGHSSILDELKELNLNMDEVDQDELGAIVSQSKVIAGDFVSVICCDLLGCSKIAPRIHALFEQQYIDFSIRITLPQKFNYV
jgi:hypothetical protein